MDQDLDELGAQIQLSPSHLMFRIHELEGRNSLAINKF